MARAASRKGRKRSRDREQLTPASDLQACEPHIALDRMQPPFEDRRKQERTKEREK